MTFLAILLAEDAAPKETGNPFSFLPIMLLIFVAFYFIFLRPMKRQEQERQSKMLSSLKKNDKIVTTFGVYAIVVSVSDTEDEVVVKIDDNTRIKMMKAAVMKNITNEEEAAKAAKEAKEAKAAAKSTGITTGPKS